ncbi:hypothetical protein ACE6H2_008232 [Prunus campanulata]
MQSIYGGHVIYALTVDREGGPRSNMGAVKGKKKRRLKADKRRREASISNLLSQSLRETEREQAISREPEKLKAKKYERAVGGERRREVWGPWEGLKMTIVKDS